MPAMFGIGYAPETGRLWVAVAFLILFGLGWGFFDSNNMPILCQVARPELRATSYGIMNLVSISCGGLADWGFGILRDRQVPLFGIFAVFVAVTITDVDKLFLRRKALRRAARETKRELCLRGAKRRNDLSYPFFEQHGRSLGALEGRRRPALSATVMSRDSSRSRPLRNRSWHCIYR